MSTKYDKAKEYLASLSTDELTESALKEDDGDKRWEFVQTLHVRGNREVFDVAQALCETAIPLQVILGADILGQLGLSDLPLKKESTTILLKLTDSLRDSAALQSVIFALGRMNNENATQTILKFKNHESEDVRYAVVHGLLTIESDEAIKALIELSDDEDDEIRNWATFGLGSMINIDSSEIREALIKRLGEKGDDVHLEILGEALLGLARRKDEKVIEPLSNELSCKSVGKLAIEAALEIADERLCESLIKLKNRWDINEDLLNDAITACCKNLDETHNS